MGALECAVLLLGLPPRRHDATCSEVEVAHTNMNLADAQRALRLYQDHLDTADLLRSVVDGSLQRAVTKEMQGEWEVLAMGRSFSYALSCARYVELAGDAWNVLLCATTWPRGAPRAAPALYHNGTFSDALFGSLERWVPRPSFEVETTTSSEEVKAEHKALILDTISSLRQVNLTRELADSIRLRLRAKAHAYIWNVVVEECGPANSGFPHDINPTEHFHMLDEASHFRFTIFSRGGADRFRAFF